eukprot:1158874-Pelagomonas_calceolata.AAC.1
MQVANALLMVTGMDLPQSCELSNKCYCRSAAVITAAVIYKEAVAYFELMNWGTGCKAPLLLGEMKDKNRKNTYAEETSMRRHTNFMPILLRYNLRMPASLLSP